MEKGLPGMGTSDNAPKLQGHGQSLCNPNKECTGKGLEDTNTIHDVGIWRPVDIEIQEKNELNGLGSGLDISWFRSIRGPGTLEPSLRPSSPDSPYNKFLPAPSFQKECQGWAAEIPYSLCLGLDDTFNTVSLADIRSPSLGSLPDMRKLNSESQKTTTPPPQSPKSSPTIFTSVPTPLFDSNNPKFTAAAHRAVADLFPELGDTCNFEANTTSSEGISRYQDTPIHENTENTEIYNTRSPVLFGGNDFANRSPQRERNPHLDLGSFEQLSSESLALKEPPDIGGQDKMYGHRRLVDIPPTTGTQTALASPSPLFTATTHAQRPETKRQRQLSSDITNLDLKGSGHSRPFDIKSEDSYPAITISPRYLSKVQLPFTPPKKSAFGSEEGYYVSEMVSSEEMGSAVGEDMPYIFGIGPGSRTSRLSDSESSSSSPAFASKDVIQCPFSSPEVSPQPKPRAKSLPRSKTVKNNAKDLLKEQNQLLLRWRSQGISYKTIKQRLGIDEAESTLRGRLRTLTKPKNQRLRKPQWMDEDIVLLLEIVDPGVLNLKWKQVSETIVALGGSYKFGPSTCKKQYMKLVANGQARPLAECTAGK